MKNRSVVLALLCALVFGFSGCDDKQEVSRTSAENTRLAPPSSAVSAIPQPESSVSPVPASGPEQEIAMPEIAQKNNCTACHAIDHKIVGPAWMDVALKYKDAKKFEYDGKEYPLIEGLIKKVSLGGGGHWGAMPMPPNDFNGIKQADIRQLVLFVLGLAKQK